MVTLRPLMCLHFSVSHCPRTDDVCTGTCVPVHVYEYVCVQICVHAYVCVSMCVQIGGICACLCVFGLFLSSLLQACDQELFLFFSVSFLLARKVRGTE